MLGLSRLLWQYVVVKRKTHPHPDPLPSRERGARPLLTAYCLLPAGALLVAGFLLLNGARWAQTAFGGERFREDWRGAVAYLEQRHAPGEPVLVLHDASFHAVDYYRAEPMALTSLEGGPERPPDLSKAPSTSGRTWLLAAYFEAPDLPSLEAWLEARGQLANKTWLTGVMVSEYTIREGPMANRSGGPAAVRSCHSTHARRQDSPPSKRGSHPSTCPPPPE